MTCQNGAIYRRTVVTQRNRRELVKYNQPLKLLFWAAEMWVRFDVIVGINSVRSRELGELTQLPPQGSLQVSVTQTA